MQFATERELATRDRDRESKLLRSVRAPLARIDEGGSTADDGVNRVSERADRSRELGTEPGKMVARRLGVEGTRGGPRPAISVSSSRI